MKRLVSILVFTGLFLMVGNLFGQNTLKIGHINSGLVFAAMPESDSAQKKLERSAKQMQAILEETQVEFNKKYEEYTRLANDATTSALITTSLSASMRLLGASPRPRNHSVASA